MEHDVRTFDDIVGHGKQVALLRRTLASGRVADGYLFAGPAHIGKKTAAALFASGLNCERDSNGPCGECLSCRKVRDGNHPDVRRFGPDGATFKIDQVRALRREISLRPLEGRYKVYILTDVDKMRAEGANALLKTLEEPPGAGVLILITQNVNALLPTIRSRCQLLNFLRVPAEEVTRVLVSHAVPPEKAGRLALLSEGRIGEAMERADSKDALDDDLPEVLTGPAPLDAFRIAEAWARDPESLDHLLTWYRDLMFIVVGVAGERLVHRDHRDALRLIARQETYTSLRNKMRVIIEGRRRLQRNINAALTMEVLAFKLMQTPLNYVRRLGPTF